MSEESDVPRGPRVMRSGSTSISDRFDDTDEDLDIYEALIDPSGGEGKGGKGGKGGAPMMMPPGMMGGGAGGGAGAGAGAGGLGAAKAGLGASGLGGGSIGPGSGGGGLKADAMGVPGGGTSAAGLGGSGVRGDLDGDGIPDDLDGDGIADHLQSRNGPGALGDPSGVRGLDRNGVPDFNPSQRPGVGDLDPNRNTSGFDRDQINRDGLRPDQIAKTPDPNTDPRLKTDGLDPEKVGKSETPKIPEGGMPGGGMPGGGMPGGGMPGGGGGMPGGGGGMPGTDVEASVQTIRDYAKKWDEIADSYQTGGAGLNEVALGKADFGYAAEPLHAGYDKLQLRAKQFFTEGEKEFRSVASKLRQVADKYDETEGDNKQTAGKTKK